MSPKDAYNQILEACGNQSPSLAIVYERFQQFEDDNENISNLPQPRRPLSLEKVDAIKNYIQDYPVASCPCIARIMEIDKNTFKRVLTEYLYLKKVHFKWVQHLLTPIQKAKSFQISSSENIDLTFLHKKRKKLVTIGEYLSYMTYHLHKFLMKIYVFDSIFNRSTHHD